jgi:tRNA/tmRNA/rRNA uracil-C5-methylase (TrmA/RlmC/RlmD family)
LVARGYKLSHVQPWDFYPQTHHVEVVSLLERV